MATNTALVCMYDSIHTGVGNRLHMLPCHQALGEPQSFSWGMLANKQSKSFFVYLFQFRISKFLGPTLTPLVKNEEGKKVADIPLEKSNWNLGTDWTVLWVSWSPHGNPLHFSNAIFTDHHPVTSTKHLCTYSVTNAKTKNQKANNSYSKNVQI